METFVQIQRMLLCQNTYIGCFPHEEILDDVPHRLPREKVFLDAIEVLAVLLDRLFKEVGLSTAPVLHLVPTEHRTSSWHQTCQRLADVILVSMQRLAGELG